MSESDDQSTPDLGHPVPVVVVGEDHSFHLDEEAISNILVEKDIANLPVTVISVAGAFRKGKSFLLNFLLRYLSTGGGENWIGSSEDALSGFSWRGGSDRDTTGIMMWSKVFRVKIKDGRETAVVLMDTQGAFDSTSTVKDCATIFALSTMTSSLQIYNISQNIQEDDLQHLELFTEYGRLAMEEFTEKPFQSLQFLIRDWSFPYEHEYGEKGGIDLLNKRLEINEKQHEELQRVRGHIRSCFTDLSCFLMPHPGLSVATNPHFKGSLKDITPEFKDCMLMLAPRLLSVDNLQVKKINGVDITCSELVEYFRSYIKIYCGEKLPEPKSMLQATAEANNLAAVAKAKDAYMIPMEELCGGSSAFLNPTTLQDKHLELQEKALETFDNTRKMGGVDFSASYRTDLEVSITDAFENFKKSNEAKNIFRNFKTPGVFVGLMLLCYLLSGLFGFLYLTAVAQIFNLGLIGCFIAISVWGYVRFTGEHQQLGQSIDVAADLLLKSFMESSYKEAIDQGTQQLGQQALRHITKAKTN